MALHFREFASSMSRRKNFETFILVTSHKDGIGRPTKTFDHSVEHLLLIEPCDEAQVSTRTWIIRVFQLE